MNILDLIIMMTIHKYSFISISSLKNIIFQIKNKVNSINKSEFDDLLISELKKAMDNNQFKFKIDDNIKTRYSAEKWNFLITVYI